MTTAAKIGRPEPQPKDKPVDPEIRALRTCSNAVRKLDPAQLDRVLTYLKSRYGR